MVSPFEERFKALGCSQIKLACSVKRFFFKHWYYWINRDLSHTASFPFTVIEKQEILFMQKTARIHPPLSSDCG
jgi:hypothetical protein